MSDIYIYPSLNSYVENTPIGAATNWQAVAYPSSGAYVRGSIDGTYTTDIYEPVHPYILGTITNVRVSYAARASSAGHHAMPFVRRSGTEYNGAAEAIPGDNIWRTYTYDWAVSPFTGGTWTEAEILILYFGIRLDHSSALATEVRCTVTYTPTANGLLYATGTYTIFQRWILQSSQTLEVSGHITKAAGHNKPLVSGVDCVIAGTGALNGGFVDASNPVVSVSGTVEIRGTSSAQPLVIQNNLYHGIEVNVPTNCLIQDVITQDCRSGTSTVPVIGDSSLGMGVWLNGAGTGNVLRRVTAKRCGIHGIQVYGSDNNTLDYIDVDGVYGYFGLSLYQTDGTTVSNVTTANTRREGVNLMQCVGSSLTDFAVRNGQTDYGVSDYLCDGSTIQRGTIDRTHKDGLAIVGSDNGQYDHIVITKACQGRYIGHYAGIMLEGSDSVGCENNTVEWCTIEDLDHRQIFNIKEVAYIPSGTNLTNSNIIRNNRCYGAIRGPVRTVGSLSTQTNNGVIEIV